MTENRPAGRPAPLAQNGKGNRRERCLAGRLQHHGATGGKGRACLAGDHGVREVPWRDRRNDADGLLQDENALVLLVAGNNIAVNAACFFGKPFDKARTIGDFALGLGERLTLFQRQDATEVVLVRHHQFEPLAQHAGAFLGCAGGPFLLDLLRSRNGLFGFRCAEFRGGGGGGGTWPITAPVAGFVTAIPAPFASIHSPAT